jgi:tRNA dimethylallyltransferase
VSPPGRLPPLIVIAGETASGKTALSLALGERLGAEIISADSRQVYRGFDVGTAKPAPNELKEVPHVGIDVAGPEERYSAARFAALARSAIAECQAQGRDVVVVGGTGFYVRALVEPLFPEPELDARHRTELGRYLDAMDTPTLRAWCVQLDPPRSALGRTQLLRALEIALLTGRRLSDHFRSASAEGQISARYLVVDPGKPLAQKIENRVDTMLGDGWIDEVRRLVSVVPSTAPAWNATGYEMLRRYVAGDGDLDLTSVRSRIIQATRQYAKRQRTWFRHQLRGDMQVLDPNEQHALERALAWWRGDA